MNVADIFEHMAASFHGGADVNKTFQWNVQGEQAGRWAITVENGHCRLVPGGVTSPDIVFEVVDQDWLAIADGTLNAVYAFMSGRVKIHGDMMLAMKAQRYFPPGH
jgi:putative sterol carrier protein